MTDMTTYIRQLIRQTFVLIAVVGLTFAAGINWAEAATLQPSGDTLNALHAIALFAATIGILLQLMIKPRRRARVRARVRNNRIIRR